jgi:hypothetical protein
MQLRTILKIISHYFPNQSSPFNKTKDLPIRSSRIGQNSAEVGLAFDTLFPHIRPGGFYVVEDWGTGYWPNWPDGELPQSSNHLAGMVGLVKQFVDVVGIPAINRLRNPPSIHEANWSTMNSPYEYVIYYPGIACVKKAIPPGEPMHSPLARKDPSAGPWMIDDVAVKHPPGVWTSVSRWLTRRCS